MKMRQIGILSKTLEKQLKKASKKTEQTVCNQIGQIASEQEYETNNKVAYITHFKAYLDNLKNY